MPTALRRSLLLLATSFGLVTWSALASGEAETVGWAAAVFGVVVLALTVPRVGWARSALAAIVGVYAVGASVAVIALGAVGWLDGSGARVEVFGDNPNLVGAGVALAALAWAAVAPGRRWVWWVWPLAVLAVLSTGSRTAALALAAGVVAWGALHIAWSFAGARARALAVAGVVALPVLAVAVWQVGVVEQSTNLLVAPNDFTHPAWNHARAQSFSVTPDAAPGPYPGTRAQRITVEAGAISLVLLQGIGVSELGEPYVASVYLRADEPQTLGLGSHLASVRCDVGTEWSRCVTPVGYGNARSIRQHRFSTDATRTFDVYAYGAQYERGEVATPFVERPSWWPQAIINRFDLRWMLGAGTGRADVHAAALEQWRTAPVFGFGRTGAERALADALEHLSTVPRHAHNQLLQLLLEDGAVGVIGWSLALMAIALLVPAGAWPALVPLMVGVVAANWWDTTLFTRLSFYVVVVAVGVVTAGNPGRRGEDESHTVRDAS